jgi:hypothetical protein
VWIHRDRPRRDGATATHRREVPRPEARLAFPVLCHDRAVRLGHLERGVHGAKSSRRMGWAVGWKCFGDRLGALIAYNFGKSWEGVAGD